MATSRHRHVRLRPTPPLTQSHLPLVSPDSTESINFQFRKSSADIYDLATHRLLSNKPFLDFISDSQTVVIPSQTLLRDSNCDDKRLNLDTFPAIRSLFALPHESPVFIPSYTAGKLIDHLNAHRSSFTPSNRHQVVELRVSIHCKGCEEKLRKYISRMEDLETKKVTVIGRVTPLGVLSSISKVKNAQFWPSPAFSSSSSSPSPSPRVTTLPWV